MGAKASADVKASFAVRPSRSQGFLVTVGLVSLVPMLCAAFLAFMGSPMWWAFLLFAAFMLMGCGLAWERSQSDSDLADAPSTELELPDGTKFTTDSRNLRSPKASAVIEGMLQVVRREKLPMSAGKVDDLGNPIAGSASQAALEIQAINAEVEHHAAEVLSRLGVQGDSAFSSLQAPDGGPVTLAPPVDLPPLEQPSPENFGGSPSGWP